MIILFVDDDAEDRQIFSDILSEIVPDSSLIHFAGGEDAVRYMRSPDPVPDIIFLDMHMDGMDGKECLLKLRSMKAFMRIPIIIYSGLADGQETIYAKLGASGFLKKSSHLTELKSGLTAILSRFR